jgi:preprotein translocase subunit SecA
VLKWLANIIGDTSESKLKKLQHLVVATNDREEDVQPLTDAELRARTDEFRQRLDDGEDRDDILPTRSPSCGRCQSPAG